jgi:hypothetical protein
MSSQDFEGQDTRGSFYREKPKVSHFHVFGCPVYIHVPDKKRTKLEPSSIKGIFVGYNKTSKAYQIYVPTQQKTVVSRDVKFVEDGWSSKSQEPSTKTEEGEKVVVPLVDLKEQEKSDLDQPGSSEGTETSKPTNTARKSRWLTQTLQDAQEASRSAKDFFLGESSP